MTCLPGGSLTKGLGSASGALAISLSRACQAPSGAELLSSSNGASAESGARLKQCAVAGWSVALASSFNDRSPCGGSVPEQPPYRQAKESEGPRRPDDGCPLHFCQRRRKCMRFMSARTTVSKKLRLQKESIRALLGPELRQVHGGEAEGSAEQCEAS